MNFTPLVKPVYGPTSLLRYPGGKHKISQNIANWFKTTNCTIIAEPFAGSAAISIYLLRLKLAQQAIISDANPRLIALWKSIINQPQALAEKITNTHIDLAYIQQLYSPKYTTKNKSELEIGFDFLIHNRTAFGGIQKASYIKNGDSSKKHLCRYTPQTLLNRLNILQTLNITTAKTNSWQNTIENLTLNPKIAFYIDPPYMTGNEVGKNLYTYYDVNPNTLFATINKIPNPWIMSYSDNAETRTLCKLYNFQTQIIPVYGNNRSFKTEMLIFR